MFIFFVNLSEQRAPRKIGAKPTGLPSKNKEFTYLLIFHEPFNIPTVFKIIEKWWRHQNARRTIISSNLFEGLY